MTIIDVTDTGEIKTQMTKEEFKLLKQLRPMKKSLLLENRYTLFRTIQLIDIILNEKHKRKTKSSK